MSVPEGQRGESKLEVLVKARELASYTLHVCCNENVFLPQYQTAITGKIQATAINIFIYCWTANNIIVGRDPCRWAERKRLQERAANNCNNLIALIQLAQEVFHLKLKRIRFWSVKTINARNLIRAWKDADCKRYDPLFNR